LSYVGYKKQKEHESFCWGEPTLNIFEFFVSSVIQNDYAEGENNRPAGTDDQSNLV